MRKKEIYIEQAGGNHLEGRLAVLFNSGLDQYFDPGTAPSLLNEEDL